MFVYTLTANSLLWEKIQKHSERECVRQIKRTKIRQPGYVQKNAISLKEGKGHDDGIKPNIADSITTIKFE